MNGPTFPVEEPLISPRRERLVAFLVFLALGTLVYLATNVFIAGTVMPSVYASWSSFRTARWIARVDQNEARARVCSAFCVATGFWHATAAAVISLVVFAFATEAVGKKPDMEQFAVTMITLVIGVVLTSAIGLKAAISAARKEIRVWVHPRLRELARDDLQEAAHLSPVFYFNHAMFVTATAVAFPIIGFCCFLFAACIPHLPDNDAVVLLFGSAFFAGIVLGPLIGYGWLASRMITHDPADCWGE